jgi:hypothetical protein
MTSGERALPVDWVFPVPPRSTMPAVFDRLDAQLRSGRLTVDELARQRDPVRTLAIVWLLADRTGRSTDGLPGPDRVIEVYRQSSKCFGSDCRPTPDDWVPS